MQPLDVSDELLDAVDLAAALDLDGDDWRHRDRGTAGRSARSRSGTRGATRVMPPRSRAATAASSSCRWASTPSFCSPGSIAEVTASMSDRTSCERDRQRLALRVGHGPRSRSAVTKTLGAFIQLSGLYAPPSAWIGDATVGFHHDQPHGLGEVGGQSAGVVDRATSYDEAHARAIDQRRRARRCDPGR